MRTTDFLRVSAKRENAFPKELRLTRAEHFQAVYDRGKKKASRSFVVFVQPNGLSYSRFGLTTPRKLGRAYLRNRIRRRVREILRAGQVAIPGGFDIVINPRRSVNERAFRELDAELLFLIRDET